MGINQSIDSSNWFTVAIMMERQMAHIMSDIGDKEGEKLYTPTQLPGWRARFFLASAFDSREM